MIKRWGKFLVSDPTAPDDGMSLNREEWTVLCLVKQWADVVTGSVRGTRA